ncbi:MAG TPA: Gfo/Idh/MocA family oxidoreductase [Blastocatellia bacterium]|nr:Gfo/Idh/MocA family oxidoreductase [Blastocatellia bacterium]
MSPTSRRNFLAQAGSSALAAAAVRSTLAQGSPNDRINVAIAGLHWRGMDHIQEYAKLPNVRIAALCDVDERLFPHAVAEVEKLTGHRPITEFDLRRLLDRKDIDAISIATPDYWHALQTIWACQAGKDVYVEKPISFSVSEGRRMIEAARKYKRIVQAGTQYRSEAPNRAAIRLLHEGKLGKVYRASTDFSRPRMSIGRQKETAVPPGVHWDLYLGPTPMRPFTINHFHYGWHYFWDTGPSEIGNIGIHTLDVCRWGLGKREHPVKVHCVGGKHFHDSEQETPNLQIGTIEYADGSLINFEVTNLFAPPRNGGMTFYTSNGYMTSNDGWKAFRGMMTPRNRPHPAGVDEAVMDVSFPQMTYTPVPGIDPSAESQASHFANFIASVRSRKVEDLHADIEEGHLSTTLAQLATISGRVGRKLVFDPKTETITGDAEANRMLTRQYRKPYTLPDKV